MQLSFRKQENGEVEVLFKEGTKYEDFSYPEMIRKLFVDRGIDESEMVGEFSESEEESIIELTKEIRKAIANADKEIKGNEEKS